MSIANLRTYAQFGSCTPQQWPSEQAPREPGLPGFLCSLKAAMACPMHEVLSPLPPILLQNDFERAATQF